VTTLRYSRAAGSAEASSAPHELQKRDPFGFSAPQLGQIDMREAYDAG
jgi:hypothetical protein